MTYQMQKKISPVSIVRFLKKMNVKPVEAVSVKQGFITIWSIDNLFLAQLILGGESAKPKPGQWIVDGGMYENTYSAQEIANHLESLHNSIAKQ